MESKGKVGHIHVSETTKNLLEKYCDDYFIYEEYSDLNLDSIETKIKGYLIKREKEEYWAKLYFFKEKCIYILNLYINLTLKILYDIMK